MSTSESFRLPPVEQAPAGEADAGRMLQMLWRGKWILLIVPLLAFGGARLWLDRQVELYVATAQVQVDARSVNVMKTGAGEAINKPRTVLKQQQGLFKSTTLLKRIAESPALQGLETFAPERLGGKTLVGALYDGLQTSIDVESDRLFLTFTSPSRQDAVIVVDEALRVYIDYQKEKKREQAEELAEIVRAEWNATRGELEETSAEIARLQEENLLLAGTERTPLQTKLDSCNNSLTTAHVETQRQRAVLEDMRAAKADPRVFRERALYWRATHPLQALEERINTARNTREEKEKELEKNEQRKLGAQHPIFAQLREEIATLRQQEEALTLQYADEYLRNAEVEYERARIYEQSLQADMEGLLAQVTHQNQVLNRIKDLTIARDGLRGRVASFDDRITQLELENQTGALNLDVIEYARAANRPAFPEVEKTYIYAVGGGCILAFGLVLLLGLSDRRLREVEDLPGLLGTSVLGVLPEVAGGRDRAKVARLVEEDPGSLVAEGIRATRTATTFALPGGRGVVAVTSPKAGEGKSVCASNLAFALAKAGKRTLLIDADMRKPAQHEVYGVENAVGLAGLLDSAAAVKRAIVPSVAVGLDLLPAGEPRGKAAELCEGEPLVQLLENLRETYECIVIDAPPVLETSEARVLARLADALVLVMRLELSRAPDLKRAVGILRGVGARILGVLPNGATSRRGARAYSGGISFGQAQAPTNTGARPRAGGEGEQVDDARARGTDFLGLEEESA